MGGNLYKLGRIPKEEYLKIEAKVCSYLNTKIGVKSYAIPKFYEDKADFGDLDILINSNTIEDWQTLKKEIVTDLNIQQYKSVGNVFSTVYENFQVDFFIKPEKYFLSTYHFLSFNDVGNIIGRMFRRFNLKYGEKGLLYVFRRKNNTHYAKEILLTQDFERIFNFLELDYNKWKVGFKSREEVFNWVIKSPYFSTDPYLEENKSIKKRKQRPTMIAFLAFLNDNNIVKKPSYLEKEACLERINTSFLEANLFEKINIEEEREAFVNIIKEKYNGRIIMELFPDLEGKELGSFMVSFQNSFNNHEEELYRLSKNEIINLLKKHKRNHDTQRT